jgi:hypothetical protein
MSTVRTEQEQLIERHLREHPEWSNNDIAAAVGGNRQRVLRLVNAERERLAAQLRLESVE